MIIFAEFRTVWVHQQDYEEDQNTLNKKCIQI